MSNRQFRADPILRLLPDEIPRVFAGLDPVDQGRRGRLWLVLWSAGYPEWVAWTYALAVGTEAEELMDDTLSRAPDTEIPKLVEGRRIWDEASTRLSGLAQEPDPDIPSVGPYPVG